MSVPINQKEYLKRYLSGPSDKDKKKKKKKVVKGKGFAIVDADIDLSKIRPLDGDELDILMEGEDAPQVAGIIDERPEEVKKLEQYKTSSKWKVINQDDGFNSKVCIEEIQTDIKQQEKENEVMFGKMYSDSEEEGGNKTLPDMSTSKPESNKEKSRKKTLKNNSDSDNSPPKKMNKELASKHGKDSKNGYDSDPSPPRKHENRTNNKRRKKPSRWADSSSNQISDDRSKSSYKRDFDQSPLRKSRRSSVSPQKSRMSAERNRSKEIRFDKREKYAKESTSRRRKSNDSDISPPRKKKSRQESVDSDLSPPRKRHYSTDSDLSPPRKSNARRKSNDSVLSPPRKSKVEKGKSRFNQSPQRNDNRNLYLRTSESPPPSNKKMAKTLEGKMAGLQNAVELRRENQEFRRKENEVFNKMTDELSGRNAEAVSRKAKKRETSEERRQKQEKSERQKEIDEKYKRWNRGLKQVQDQEAKFQEYLHEASKPLARTANDADLEASLRQIDREGDPMLDYIREKRRERGELPPEKPMYKGNFPPNRFNIRPGYRWDGVDRSNGYEQKYFENKSKRRAQEEEYYKWSSADL